MADYKVTDTQLTAIADAIRAKTGGESSLSFPDGFISSIGNTLKLSYSDAYNSGLDAAEDQSDVLDLPMMTGDEKIIVGTSTDGVQNGQNQVFGFYYSAAMGGGVYSYERGNGHSLAVANSLVWDSSNLQLTAGGSHVFGGTYYILAFT